MFLAEERGIARSIQYVGKPSLSLPLRNSPFARGVLRDVRHVRDDGAVRTGIERFGAKAGFTIYEGDWGKPYAARFEVWFEPDSGKDQRKLAERVFKIEGWQR